LLLYASTVGRRDATYLAAAATGEFVAVVGGCGGVGGMVFFQYHERTKDRLKPPIRKSCGLCHSHHCLDFAFVMA
jgi:hypothetical protein